MILRKIFQSRTLSFGRHRTGGTIAILLEHRHDHRKLLLDIFTFHFALVNIYSQLVVTDCQKTEM